MTGPDPVQRVVKAAARESEQWRRTLGVVRGGLRGLARSQIPRMGAALAYRTLFSLIPVLVVGVSVLGSFLSDVELRQQMDRLIDFVGLDSIAIEQTAEVPEASPETAGSEVVSPAAGQPAAGIGAGGVPTSPRLDEWIAALVARVSSLPYRAIGFVGVLVLLYGAISMLVELERSFNQIYGASSGRSWVKRVTTYWTTLTLGVVFLLATFSVGDAAGNWVASLVSGEGGGWLSRGVVEFTVNIVINTLLLLLAYSTVPNTRVHIRPALAGAAVAGVAWELGKIGFTQYVRHAVGGLEQLYGVLALLPLFMLWVYITWIIILFGLQVSYTLQTFGSQRDEPSAGASTDPVDPALVLTIARMALERFREGGTLLVDDIVTNTGVSAAPVERLIRGLVEGGVLREVEQGDDRAWVLARPGETIPVADLLAIARRVRQGGDRGGSEAVDEALSRSLHGVVLSSLEPGGEQPDIRGGSGG